MEKEVSRYSLLFSSLVVVFLCVSSPLSLSQSISLPVKKIVDEYYFNELKYLSGEPIRDVVDIRQDKNGFIWLASRHGLIRYDGHDFKIYRHIPNDDKSIVDTDIRCLEIMGDSLLLIGCNYGISIMNVETGEVSNLPVETTLCPTRHINCFFINHDGIVWIAGLSGLYSLTPDLKRVIDHQLKIPQIYPNTPSANQVYVINYHPFDKNLLLLGTEFGLISFDKKNNKIHKTYPNEEIRKLPYSYPSVTYIIIDGQYAWCRSWESGINRFDLIREEWTNFGFPDYMGKGPLAINSMIARNEKELWVVDNNHSNGFGAFNKESGLVTFAKDIYSVDSQIPDPPFYLYLPPDSILWLSSSDGKGLFRQNKKKYRFHELDIPFSGQWVCDVHYDAVYNDYYFGMLIDSKGIARWNTVEKKWTLIKPVGNPDPSDFPAYLFLEDTQGTLWVGVGKRSLWYIDKKENVVKPFLLPDRRPIDNEGYSIVALFEDSKHQLWIGTSGNGVICLNEERTKATYYKHQENDTSSLSKGTHFRGIAEDNQGRLWFGNSNGFCVFNPETGKFLQQNDDKLFAGGIRPGIIHTILKDTIGRIWMSIEGQGLVCISEEPKGKFSFKIYGTEEGLKDLVIRSMRKDKNGCFWIKNNGLLYFNPYNESYMLTDLSNGLLKNCYENDGIYIDDFGNVFCGNQVGIDWMAEVSKQSESTVKNIFIEDILVNGKPTDWSARNNRGIVLSSAENNITFVYTAISFENNEHIRYRYKLLGLEQEWNSPTSLLEARYTSLAPGRYRFVVDVAYKGKWLHYNSFVDFKIEQVLWKRWWFIALMALILGGIVYSIVMYRVRQLYKLQRLRVKIASDLHDDVGSTLSSISIMSDLLQSQLDNTLRTEEMIRRIGFNAHNMLESMDDIVWSVNPANDKFQDLDLRIREYAIPLFESKNICFQIITPHDLGALSLSMDVRRNIFLIAKEAVNNLVKYSGCSKVTIEYSFSRSILTMKIEDDGKGFDPEQNENSHRNGLKNMKQRAGQIDGKLFVNSRINEGTSVVLSVKII